VEAGEKGESCLDEKSQSNLFDFCFSDARGDCYRVRIVWRPGNNFSVSYRHSYAFFYFAGGNNFAPDR
jgi:hypothetical protein